MDRRSLILALSLSTDCEHVRCMDYLLALSLVLLNAEVGSGGA